MACLRVSACFIVASLLLNSSLAAICPNSCICSTTRDGLHRVTCSNLAELYKYTLRQKHHNINILDLSHNNITKITHELDRLTEVVTLDLSTNRLTVINKFLHNARKLVHLNLANNRIYKLSFTYLPNSVSSLDLTNNLLEDVPSDISQLDSLEHLKLEGNPLHCSCDNIITRDHLLSLKVYIDDVKCQSPSKLKGRSWLELKTKEICKAHKSEWMDMMMGDQPMDAMRIGKETSGLKPMSLVSGNDLEDSNIIHGEELSNDDDSVKFMKVGRLSTSSPIADIEGSGDAESTIISDFIEPVHEKKILGNVITTEIPLEESSDAKSTTLSDFIEPVHEQKNLSNVITTEIPLEKSGDAESTSISDFIEPIHEQKILGNVITTEIPLEESGDTESTTKSDFIEPVHEQNILGNVITTEIPLEESGDAESTSISDFIEPDHEQKILGNVITTEIPLEESGDAESTTISDFIEPVHEQKILGNVITTEIPLEESGDAESTTISDFIEPVHEQKNLSNVITTELPLEESGDAESTTISDFIEPVHEQKNLGNVITTELPLEESGDAESTTISDLLELVHEQNILGNVITTELPLEESGDAESTTISDFIEPVHQQKNLGNLLASEEILPTSNAITTEIPLEGSGDAESTTISDFIEPVHEQNILGDLLASEEILPVSNIITTEIPLEGSGGSESTTISNFMEPVHEKKILGDVITTEIPLDGSGDGFGDGYFTFDYEEQTERLPETTTPVINEFNPEPVHKIFENDEESNGSTTEFPIPEPPSIYQGGVDWHSRNSDVEDVTEKAVTPQITRDTTVSEQIRITQASEVLGQIPSTEETVTPHKTGTYVCIALIVALLVGLIGFAIAKGQMRKRRDRRFLRQQKRDVEKASKEMVDMNKTLLGKPAAIETSIDKKTNGKYELVPTHENNVKKSENGDVVNGIKQNDDKQTRTESPRDTNQNKSSSKDNNLIDDPVSHQETSFDSEPASPKSDNRHSLSSEDIFVPIDDDSPRLNGTGGSDISQPLLNGANNSEYLSPSREYVPVYSPDMGRVRIKMSETPKPKTPVLVTRSRSNAGDIIITPSLDGNARKSAT